MLDKVLISPDTPAAKGLLALSVHTLVISGHWDSVGISSGPGHGSRSQDGLTIILVSERSWIPEVSYTPEKIQIMRDSQ